MNFFKSKLVIIWAQLFRRWITLSVFLILIRWVVIYTMDSAIRRLNNRGLTETLRPIAFPIPSNPLPSYISAQFDGY